jgi:hypothetical protein
VTGRPIFVRWEESEEFYPGSVDEHAGPRTFFGLDCDGPKDENGNQLFIYNSYTADAQQVFLNEVARITGNLVGLNDVEFVNSTVYMNHATQQLVVEMNQLSKVEVIDLVGRQIYCSPVVNENKIFINLNFVKSGIYLVKLSNSSNNVVTAKFVK